MSTSPTFVDGVWAVDFEFHPAHGRQGNSPEPVCMVARELNSGTTIRVWQDELAALSKAPFPTGPDALFVAYYASAEVACFLALGWPLPTHTLDLYAEFRCLTNGSAPAHGNGLLGALLHFGLPSRSAHRTRALHPPSRPRDERRPASAQRLPSPMTSA